MKKRIQRRDFENNFFAIQTLRKESKRRLVHIILGQLLRYFEWLFFSVFFIRMVLGYTQNNESFTHLFYVLLGCFIVFSLTAIYKVYVKYYVIPQTDCVIHTEVCEKIYRKACNVELACYEDADFYNKYTLAINNVKDKIVHCCETFFDIVVGTVASIIAFVVIIQIDLWCGVFLIFPIFANFVLGKKINEIYYHREKDTVRENRVSNYVNQVLASASYAKELRFYNMFSLLIQQYSHAIDNMIEIVKKYSRKLVGAVGLKNIMTFPIPFEGIMIYASYRAIVSESLPLNDMAIIYSTMATTSWILIGLFKNVNEFIKNSVEIEFIKDFLNYKEVIPEDQDGLLPEGEIHTIQFEHVSFGYKEDEFVLKDVCFEVSEKNSLALVGRNGSGKSTIIKLLLRLYDPTSGTIYVNGVDIRKYNLQAYRELFQTTFQDYSLLAMSIKDNICMGREIDDSKVMDALKAVDLYDKIVKLPNSIYTVISKEFDDEGAVFSGGESQKLTVARTLVCEGNVCVYDEPSASLDPVSENRLYRQILCENKCEIMIFVSHQMYSVKDVDNILVLEDGRIKEKGAHEELLAMNGLYKKMYQVQGEQFMLDA